jgi:Nucleotidyl transferase AbiEii toxin, Type IV TA system
MAADCLHKHPQFPDLIRIVAEEKGIAPALVEKDYWIMHCLYGLQQLGLKFELKGGTSLSKGHGIIHRFSEDIDIRIEPPPELHVKTGRNHTRQAHVESRRKFYDWLAKTIRINGIEKVARDTAFDTTHLFSGGIRLSYKSITQPEEDLREGVLLEAGFDVVAPNTPQDISSWAHDHAASKIDVTIIAPRACCVTTRATPLSRSCKPFRRNSAGSRRKRIIRSTSCGTTTMCTAY